MYIQALPPHAFRELKNSIRTHKLPLAIHSATAATTVSSSARETAAAGTDTITKTARGRTLARRSVKLPSIVRNVNHISLHGSQPDQQHRGQLAGKIPRLTRDTLLIPRRSDEQPVRVQDLHVHERGRRLRSVNQDRRIAGPRETLVLHELETARARRVAAVVVGERALLVLVVGAVPDAGDFVDVVHR